MIAKDEERFIGDCLLSVKGLVDEIILVDTGSSDGTINIARQHGAKIVACQWNNDFSAARNIALSHATGDWILVLDADEVLDLQSHDAIRESIKDNSVWGYRIPIFNYSHDSTLPGWSSVTNHSLAKGFPGFVLTRIVRLFSNKPEIKYRFSVHEGVEFSIEEHEGALGAGSFVIHHYGALRGTSNETFKHETYFALVRKDCEQYPNHPKPFYELGIGYMDIGDFEKAKQSFEHAITNDEHYLTPYHHLGEIAFRQGNLAEARNYFEKSLTLHPESEETYFRLGQVALKMQDLGKARVLWGKALEKNPRSIRYFDALIQLHLSRGEPLQALALLYDACMNTQHLHFMKEKEKVEQQLVDESKRILAQGPEKKALTTLVTVAFYRKEMKKAIALCNEAKKYFTGQEGRVFDVLIEKATSQESHP